MMRRAWMGGRGGLHLHEDALQAWWCCPVVHGGGAGRGKMRETTRRRRSKCSSIRTQEQAGGADCGPSLSPPIGLAVSSRAHGTPRTCRGPRASPAPRGRAPAAPPRVPSSHLPCASKADEMEKPAPRTRAAGRARADLSYPRQAFRGKRPRGAAGRAPPYTPRAEWMLPPMANGLMPAAELGGTTTSQGHHRTCCHAAGAEGRAGPVLWRLAAPTYAASGPGVEGNSDAYEHIAGKKSKRGAGG